MWTLTFSVHHNCKFRLLHSDTGFVWLDDLSLPAAKRLVDVLNSKEATV